MAEQSRDPEINQQESKDKCLCNHAFVVAATAIDTFVYNLQADIVMRIKKRVLESVYFC